MHYGIFSLFAVITVLLFFILLGLTIYCLISFIHISNLAIKALNIYINKNGKEY